MLKRLLSIHFASFLLLTFFMGSLTALAQLNDSLLREQLTRGVQLWKLGKPIDAYMTLDSVMAQPTTSEIAPTKVKAAIWTATYLQQQKKNAPALRFLDSANTWASLYARGDEYRRVYEAYAQWHIAVGNFKSALTAQNQANLIKDSLSQLAENAHIDSLKSVIDTLQAHASIPVVEQKSSTGDFPSWLTIALGAIALLLLLLVFRLNTSLQRLKTLPPAPQQQARKPEPVRESKPLQVISTSPELEVISTPPPTLPFNTPVNSKDLAVRLAEVELVLVRPEILGRYGNGDWKSVKNLLNEYLTQLPLILKNLDDVITKSETGPILQGLEYLKPYLQAFGMLSTLVLIKEVEEEALQVKASKLLSRVFQVRNHTRRAADEAKSILEKLS